MADASLRGYGSTAPERPKRPELLKKKKGSQQRIPQEGRGPSVGLTAITASSTALSGVNQSQKAILHA